jgi:cysteine desulfurase
VALQWVNHETGTILPVAEYARVCREADVPLFVDATQALGKEPVDVEAMGADAVAFAAHKMGGPAGAGALWVRRGRELSSLLAGGAQERGRRAGSPDVLAHVGFGAACGALGQRLAEQPRLAELGRHLSAKLGALGGVANATEGPRAATAISAAFQGRRAEELVAALDLEGVCAAAGPACSSGLSGASAVLKVMHPEEPWRAEASLRFSFGPETTETDIEIAAVAVQTVLARGGARKPQTDSAKTPRA